MNPYEQIKRLNLYLQRKYAGFIGLPYEMLSDELMDDVPKNLKPTTVVKEAGSTFSFYSFMEVSEAIVCG
jgi:hypothetical protein